jgi:hypothetical protein
MRTPDNATGPNRCRYRAPGLAWLLACLVAIAPAPGVAEAASPGASSTVAIPLADLGRTATTTPPAPNSVAEVMALHAERELDAAEMDKMRGGFLLFTSVAVDVRVEFAALANGEFLPVAVDPSVFGAPGIYTRLTDGVATVMGTNQFRGLISNVQNNLNFQDLQTATYATFNLTGSMTAFRAGLMRSELNFTTSSLGL